MRDPFDGSTPPDTNGLRLTKVKQTAAGIPAAVSSLNHGFRKMGLTKTVRTLLMVNQKKVLIVLVAHGLILNTERRSSFAKMEQRLLQMRQ